ncbi:YggS family pyridoxal phosphate-dependent enzyme, partial [Desulfovibrio sp. XJ01]|nr:YggS family pyridoxal phosphate-dependent enzyme [Nitratidesulfovibrio liaohensis]
MPHDIAAASAFLPPEAAQTLLDRWAAVRARVDGAARA